MARIEHIDETKETTDEHEKNKVLCKECGSETFNVMEFKETGDLYIGCDKCGKGHIFGGGLTSKDILHIMQDKLTKVVYDIRDY